MASCIYDGTCSGALIAAALGTTYVISGAQVNIVTYANGMRCLVIIA